jgi:DNA-binding beta-propeller fold protein YncE
VAPSPERPLQRTPGWRHRSAGGVYVADTDNNQIQKLSSTGNYITKWGSLGSGNDQFSTPTRVTTDPFGNVYVADNRNHRVQTFKPL